MKRIMLCVIVVIIVMCLAACDSADDAVDNILECLQNNEIVDDNLELIDVVTNINAGIIINRTTYYVYETEDSELIAINYDTNVYSKYDYDYSVSVYSDVSINDGVEYFSDVKSLENYYTYSDGTKSDNNKYNFENKTEYALYKHNSFFSKTTYRIESI